MACCLSAHQVFNQQRQLDTSQVSIESVLHCQCATESLARHDEFLVNFQFHAGAGVFAHVLIHVQQVLLRAGIEVIP